MKQAAKKKGVALLLSIITVTVVLSVTLTITSFVINERKVVSDSTESAKAIYAADTGIECSLFWDIRGTEIHGYPVFSTSTSHSNHPNFPASGDGIECGGVDIPALPWTVTDLVFFGTHRRTEFQFEPSPGTCSNVVVVKYANGNTEITASGYSSPCATYATDSNVVERILQATY